MYKQKNHYHKVKKKKLHTSQLHPTEENVPQIHACGNNITFITYTLKMRVPQNGLS